MASPTYDFPHLKTPCSVIIAGPSQSGKTTFTRQILKHTNQVFDRPIKRIVYCYGEPQACFRDMAREGIQFYKGVPDNIEKLFPPKDRPGILVLDDLMRDCGEDERVLDLFTRGSHHHDVTCFYLMQNLFPPGKYSRTISLNAHYIVAFKNPRDALAIRNLAQQAFPGRVSYITACFQNATSQPYGYLLFDLHPTTPDSLRLRTNIFDASPIVFAEEEEEDDTKKRRKKK